MSENLMTIVSGYWKIVNKHGDKFIDWFKNTVNINCPYVFFGDDESIELIKRYRNINYPTHYIKLSITEFYTYKFYENIVTHPIHCPSKELNIVWNEKIFLLHIAKELNPFNTQWFCWCDAGIFMYRCNYPPHESFPNIDKMNLLKMNMINVSTSDNKYFEPEKLSSYYHYISGTYILHIDFIDHYKNIYKDYVDKFLSKNDNIYTDQVIHTLIYHNYPELFNFMYKDQHGYGKCIDLMY